MWSPAQNALVAQLHTIQRELRAIAQGWFAMGARQVLLRQGQEVVWAIPHSVRTSQERDLCAPLRHGSQTLTLCIRGLKGHPYEVKLRSDAVLLQKLFHQEYEMESLTDEFIAYQDQMLALYDLNHALRHQVELKDILASVANRAWQLMQVEHAFLIRVKGVEIPQAALAGELQFPLRVYQRWMQQVHDSEEPLKQETWVETLGCFVELLLIPIRTHQDIIAGLGFVNKPGGFTMPDIKLADALADQAGAYIENSLLMQDRIQQARMQAEMSLAHDVQLSLLPQAPTTLPGISVWASSAPAREVGGDFYDFSVTEDDTLRFALGDVAGKGMSAALLMAMSRTLLRAVQNVPESALQTINRNLYDDLTRIGSFITLFVAEYDLREHVLRYANAGHSPVVICPAQGAPTLLEADSPPVGVLPTSLAERCTLSLHPGDVLVVSSDGIPEATNTQKEMLGYEAMMQLIELYRDRDARHIGEMLLSAARSFEDERPPSDDQTVLVLKREE